MHRQKLFTSRELTDDLQAWRLECEQRVREDFANGRWKSPILSPEEFIFANEVDGFLDTDNYRKRVLHKLARNRNLPNLAF